MKRENRGQYIHSTGTGEKPFNAFVPSPLPPSPPLEMNQLFGLIERANLKLGELEGVARVLPDISVFLYMYVRKEAVLSSQIEGTQSSLSDLLAYENEASSVSVPIDDVQEVSSYVAAMDYALARLESLPLSLRFIKETHKVLMTNSRGETKSPGSFRKSQNWIGGSSPDKAIFVPPPLSHLDECLNEFEKFLHETSEMPSLIRAALAHVQFETIHPFLDGNGRMGRMLIVLMLINEGIITQPYLYLSYYFKNFRQDYYQHLQNVRDEGDWESWCEFFLTAVVETAEQASGTITNVLNLFDEHQELVVEKHKNKSILYVLLKYLQKNPITTTKSIEEKTGESKTSVLRGLSHLEALNIIKDTSGKERHRVYIYHEYLELLNKGIEI
jgi:Fic family protein